MAEFGPLQTIPGLVAAVDLSAYQYRVMRLSAAKTVNVASNNLGSSAVGLAVGVLLNKPAAAGRAATVANEGTCKVVAGAAVTVDGPITHDGSGYAINAVSGSIVIGRALEAAGAAGEIFTAQLQPPVRWGDVS